MGNFNSKTKIKQESVTENFIKSVLEVTQANSLITSSTSGITIDTNKAKELLYNARMECLNKGHTTKECLELYPENAVENIYIRGVMNINSTVSQFNKADQKQVNTIADKISSNLKNNIQGISMGSNTSIEVSDTIKNVGEAIVNAYQTQDVKNVLSQQIIVTGSGVRGVTIDSTINAVNDVLQQNTAFQDAMTNIIISHSQIHVQ